MSAPFFCSEDEAFLSVRLIGGLSEKQGRLEVFLDGQWRSIVPTQENDLMGSVVCRQLGFLGHNVSGIFPFFGVSSGLCYEGSFNCLGDEEKFADGLSARVFSAHRYNCHYLVGILCQAGNYSNTPMRAKLVPFGRIHYNIRDNFDVLGV